MKQSLQTTRSCRQCKVFVQKRNYVIGQTKVSRTVVPRLVKPNTISSGVHDLSASSSVRPLILQKIQKPLSFIQEPMSEPAPMAVARYTGSNPSISVFTFIVASMADVVIMATVLEPCAIFSRAAIPNPRNRKLSPVASPSAPPNLAWIAGPI